MPLERISNSSVPEDYIRSLGVLLDKNLSFDKHINTLALELKRALFYLKIFNTRKPRPVARILKRGVHTLIK